MYSTFRNRTYMKYKTIGRAIDSSWQRINEMWVHSERHISYGMYFLVFIVAQIIIAPIDEHLAQSEQAQIVFKTHMQFLLG